MPVANRKGHTALQCDHGNVSPIDVGVPALPARHPGHHPFQPPPAYDKVDAMKRIARSAAHGWPRGLSRRDFLKFASMAAAAPLAFTNTRLALAKPSANLNREGARVAVVPCPGYDPPEVRTRLEQAFDYLGGIDSLVAGKTVAVKINMTGTDFSPVQGLTVGETYMTHYSTALALAALLLDAGARRVQFVESCNSKEDLEPLLSRAGWDTRALGALGAVGFENTRNLGSGDRYAELRVPDGLMFSSFHLNHCYDETDVLVSLCKLKQHSSAGVTLSMKNLVGATPNALYGDEAGSEDAVAGRGPFHSPDGRTTPDGSRIALPGFELAQDDEPADQGTRIPRIVTDLCGARPIHLAVIDGISTVSGGEGRWSRAMRPIRPGLLIAGFNAVSADAVGTALMGFADPRAPRGKEPFGNCENHLLLAEQAGLGTADLAQIDVCGLSVSKARCPFPPLGLGTALGETTA